MEKSEIRKVLLEAADSIAEQVEKEEENGFLILIKENDSVSVRRCCSFMDISHFTGILMKDFAAQLRDIGVSQTMVETALKELVRTTIKDVFEEGEADEG